MSTILDQPDAQELLRQTDVDPDDLRPCRQRLTAFLARYLPLFYRAEQRQHADTLLRGKLADLQRKTTEPIATHAGQKRRPLQHFLGAGLWDDPTVRTELRHHVRQQLGEPQGVLFVDNHGVPKKGNDSCGVQRQWCGRLGKVDNCQVGYFLGYASGRGRALVDARLYLPKERADDNEHRQKTHVPTEVTFQEGWSLARDLIRRNTRELPHAFVAGDDEFGRCSWFRALLRLDQERYVLDVPSNTQVRDLSQLRPPARPGGRARWPAYQSVAVWAARQPKGRWRKFCWRGGEKGPRQVQALQQWVQTKDENGAAGARERLVVIRTCEKKAQTWYTVSNAPKEVPLAEVVGARGELHGVEELFAEGNQEVGLNHYEVRSWVGWEHHMTLTLLALWFLHLERLPLGEKKSGGECVAGASDLHGVVTETSAEPAGDRGEGEQGVAA